MAINQDTLNELLGRFVTDLGATVHAGNVVIGDRLGLYSGLSEIGPADAAALALRTGTNERYVREWLAGQAAGGYVCTDEDATTFWLSQEQQLALVDPDGVGMAGAFLLAVACLQDEPKITEAFRSGAGVGWHEHRADVGHLRVAGELGGDTVQRRKPRVDEIGDVARTEEAFAAGEDVGPTHRQC